MGTAVLVEIDLARDGAEESPDPLERVLRVEGQVVRHDDDDDGPGGFAVMATHTSIEPSSVVLEGLF